MHPDAPFIRRVGEVNAYDNPDFRAALKATGRKQVILGALLTEVCKYILAPLIFRAACIVLMIHRHHVPCIVPPGGRI